MFGFSWFSCYFSRVYLFQMGDGFQPIWKNVKMARGVHVIFPKFSGVNIDLETTTQKYMSWRLNTGVSSQKNLESILYPLSSFPACWQPPTYSHHLSIYLSPFFSALTFHNLTPHSWHCSRHSTTRYHTSSGHRRTLCQLESIQASASSPHPSSYWESYWVPWK